MLREILEYEVKEDSNLTTIGRPRIMMFDDPDDFEVQLKSEFKVYGAIGYMCGEELYIGGSKFIPVQYYTLREKEENKIE